MRPCFRAADILLPGKDVRPEYWSVIACDQYTSQPEYWRQVEETVMNRPSALHMIYPEVYLKEEGTTEQEERIKKIDRYMKQYLHDGTLTRQVREGFVLVVRKTVSGERIGLVGVLDLEEYDYECSGSSFIRATEGTIRERIPVRVNIRKNAPVEVPHVMVLADDRRGELTEWLWEKREQLDKLYDTQLMQNGGQVQGYRVDGELAQETERRILRMQESVKDMLLAVGDGNHSLAAAKEIWNDIKKNLPEEEKDIHPARYALAELVNLHSPALAFEPIHRVLSGVRKEEMIKGFREYLESRKISWCCGTEIVFVGQEAGREDAEGMKLDGAGECLPVDILQQFLDEYVEEHPGISIDYVHGEETVKKIASNAGNCGILLQPLDKKELFPAILAGGVLPRKTFSMGEAWEKRYYMECHRIR